MTDRAWREERDEKVLVAVQRAEDAFWREVRAIFPDVVDGGYPHPDPDRFRIEAFRVVGAWLNANDPLVVETKHLETVGHVARIVDVGTPDVEKYAVETAGCNDAGMECGEWQRTDNMACVSDDFRTLAAARAYVALLDAGADFHEALAFVYVTCNEKG